MPAQTAEEVHPLFVKAHNAGDLDAVMSFFEADACFVTRSARIASGLEAVREVYRAHLANRQQLVLGKLIVLPGGGDLALVIVPWTATAVLANGETKKWQGTATDVVRRQADGRWLLVLDNATGVEVGSN